MRAMAMVCASAGAKVIAGAKVGQTGGPQQQPKQVPIQPPAGPAGAEPPAPKCEQIGAPANAAPVPRGPAMASRITWSATA